MTDRNSAIWRCRFAAASITKRRKSVATSSLRLRPVWSFQPSAPSSCTKALSTKWCTSSAVDPSRNDGSSSSSDAIASSALILSCTSTSVRIPIFCNARAHARSTDSSYGSSRRSNENERWNASNALSGSRSKRPPQRRSSLRSGVGESLIVENRNLQLVLAAFGFRFRPRRHRQRKEIDKSLRVFGIVAAHREAGQIGAIQREGRLAAG